MIDLKKTVAFVVAAAVGSLFASPPPALANGAASTRNIIFGAAAIGGTLLILNHNKKVHEKYAEKDRLQAQTQEQANEAESAYASEKQAYGHEAALVSEYQKEVAYQHTIVNQKNAQIASLQHSLQVAKAEGSSTGTKFVQTASRPAPAAPLAANAPQHVDVAQATFSNMSYGWGTY